MMTSMSNIPVQNGLQGLRGYAAIGLHQPSNRLNVGCALRAAAAYGAAMVAASGSTYGRARSDTQASYRHMPFLQVDDLHTALPYDCVAVAVDLLIDAESLTEFKHPERAFYIFGPENGTLDESVTAWCRRRVYVPTRHCMNLAATVNVVLYDRLLKASLRGQTQASTPPTGEP